MYRITALVLGALIAVPGAAIGSHMGQYANDPLQRDLQGQVHEPDGVVTRVLGFAVHNCVVELPLGDSVQGRCAPSHEHAGTGLQPRGAIAPGCTGADGAGKPVRRLDGQCGFWEVGAPRPVWAPVAGQAVGPGQIAPPVSERGMGGGAYPGRYAGPVRFLDARIDPDVSTNNVGIGRTTIAAYHRLLQDLDAGGMTPTATGQPLPALAPLGALGGAILPGQHMVWAWYGQWNDLNGNGVVDTCYGGCHARNGAGINEFTWLGSCTSFYGPREPEAVEAGICREDPNPSLDPPGEPCQDPKDTNPCAGTTLTMWIWPGTHRGSDLGGDLPGRDALDVIQLGYDPYEPDEESAYGDPLLGAQDVALPDGTYHDRTGDGADTGDDTVRQWTGYLGGDSTYYGDDGLLVTMLHITGVNCAPADRATGYDLGSCTFVDVDRYPTVSGDAQGLLVGDAHGDPEHPDGGAKGLVRGAWAFVQDRLPTIDRKVDSVVNGDTLYLATQGPVRGGLDDQLLDNGWSREPNVGSATYRDAAGAQHTIVEHYVGVQHTSCKDPALFPVGDTRNPTDGHDAASDEAAHRGFCNVHSSGAPQPAYRDYADTIVATPDGPKQVGRGWMDVQPVRGVFTGMPVTLLFGPCTYCLWFFPDINYNRNPESTAALPAVRAPTDHQRTLGAGRYYFAGPVGVWSDRPFTQDESLFPDPVGTTFQTYPAPRDAFPRGDGWVGSLAGSTGQWHYRGFGFGTCHDYATDKDPGSAQGHRGPHDAAECNPYLDGHIADPQGYAFEDFGGEFRGGCDTMHMGPFHFAPASGVMETQVIAIANYGSGVGPLPELWPSPGIFAYGPGPVDPLAIPVTCNGIAVVGTTFLYWPSGGMLDDIVTWIDADIQRGAAMPGFDHVTDVDYYPAYALPVEAAPPPLPLS